MNNINNKYFYISLILSILIPVIGSVIAGCIIFSIWITKNDDKNLSKELIKGYKGCFVGLVLGVILWTVLLFSLVFVFTKIPEYRREKRYSVIACNIIKAKDIYFGEKNRSIKSLRKNIDFLKQQNIFIEVETPSRLFGTTIEKVGLYDLEQIKNNPDFLFYKKLNSYLKNEDTDLLQIQYNADSNYSCDKVKTKKLTKNDEYFLNEIKKLKEQKTKEMRVVDFSNAVDIENSNQKEFNADDFFFVLEDDMAEWD